MLNGKVIIVTGGSGLLGREIISEILKNNGIPVNFDVRSSKNALTEDYYVDITNDEEVINTIEIVNRKYGRIDGLVHSAYPKSEYFGRAKAFEDEDMKYWRKDVDIQMLSGVVTAQKVLNIMERQGSGAVVFMSSIYGVVGNQLHLYSDTGGISTGVYNMIKGGIIGLTKYLAGYFGRFNVRINCVSPGGIKDVSHQHPGFIEKYENLVPMKRMGTPDDIAPVVCFMLSDGSKYITGQNIIVDGGWTIV